MTDRLPIASDPKLDLFIERVIDVPRALVWDAWTKPEHIRNWFTPAPWTTPECTIDLRPGGLFHTIQRGPDGEENRNNWCYLEVREQERLVWTDALLPGYRPATKSFLTAVINFASEGNATRYTAMALHSDPDVRQRHEDLGFFDGWNAATDQLAAYVATL